VPLRYARIEQAHPGKVRGEVGERERDARGLLHADDAPERPFAKVLKRMLACSLARVRVRVHALVPGLVRAAPVREHREWCTRRRGSA
jgi:hypothetical protein